MACTFATNNYAQNQVKNTMDVKSNAISNSKVKPILKPPHDTILGLNQIEIFDKKISK
jgi:hypothetical protein